MSARTCLVAGCEAGVSDRRPICAECWTRLPGRERSRLSMSATLRMTDRTRAAFARAAALIGS